MKQLFEKDERYESQRANGIKHVVECKLTVGKCFAELTYEKGNPNDWHAGTTRIEFWDDRRAGIKEVLWRSPNGKFQNLRPIVRYHGDKGSTNEVERQKRAAIIAHRPDQKKFSDRLRAIYRNKCAVTHCNERTALEAAHIKVTNGKDFNDPENGILLRADIHALFDAGLIALSKNGKTIEISKSMNDKEYKKLNQREVFRPQKYAPSVENISAHRQRFKFI